MYEVFVVLGLLYSTGGHAIDKECQVECDIDGLLRQQKEQKIYAAPELNTAHQSYIEFERNNHEDDVEAYKANYGVFKGGLSREEIAEYYNKWAETGQYDTHLNPDRYTGPEVAAQALASNFAAESRRNARILDIAAGTGRLGAELFKLGFRNLDALDPSVGMLCKAMQRNIYTKFFCEFLDAVNQTSIPDSTYDGLAVAGGMGEGHIPSDAIIEMIRIVKPGGIICISMREEYLDHVSEYSENLTPLMNKLQEEGQWAALSKDVIENYALGKSGIVFQFRVK